MSPSDYAIHRQAVPGDMRDRLVRRLNLEIRKKGITAEQIEEWSGTTAFPNLRTIPEVMTIRDHIARLPTVDAQPGQWWGEPQLLLKFPDFAGTIQGFSHVDQTPPWAEDLKYQCIVCVALTRHHPTDGTLVVNARTPEAVHLAMNAGDVAVLNPNLPHASGVNRSAHVRMAVYFRLLEIRR